MIRREYFPTFRDYYEALKKEDKIYMFGGKIAGGHTPLFYGTPLIRLTESGNGIWGIGQGAIFPDFEKEPEVLSKEDFSTKMIDLGVPVTVLEEYFNFKPNLNNY